VKYLDYVTQVSRDPRSEYQFGHGYLFAFFHVFFFFFSVDRSLADSRSTFRETQQNA